MAKIYYNRKNAMDEIYKYNKNVIDVIEERLCSKRMVLGRIDGGNIDYISAEETVNLIKKISSYLIKNTFKGEIIGIFSKNRVEWMLSDYGIMRSGCISCPIYSTFGIVAVKEIIKETDMRICFISTEEVETLMKMKDIKLEKIILLDENVEIMEKLKEKGLEVSFFNDILKEEIVEGREIDMEDTATICYTSGTTGTPKGVILTHRNFISPFLAYESGVNDGTIFKFLESDVYMSYLPLAHILEREISFTVLMCGVTIVFSRGDKQKLMEDFSIIRPTFLTGVPRVFDMIKQKIEKEVEKNKITKFIFNAALAFKSSGQKYGKFKSIIFDPLVFSKVKAKFGGRIRGVLSGSSPIAPELIEFIQSIFSCPLYQGYGLTESSASVFLSVPGIFVPGALGIPLSHCKVKLVGDSPTEGELYVKGPNVFKGYYKNPEVTAEVFENGWMKTGDILKYEGGLFYFISRAKNNFKTSIGEYIVPEKIEGYFKGGIIHDIFITGDSMKNYIVAIVVNPGGSNVQQLVEQKIKNRGEKLVSEGKLMKFEIPKKVFISSKPFQELKDCTTKTTMKLIRKNTKEFFKKEIEEMMRN